MKVTIANPAKGVASAKGQAATNATLADVATKLGQVVDTLQAVLAELEKKTEPADVQTTTVGDGPLGERSMVVPLSRLTFTATGLRCDAGGSAVSIAANQSLSSVAAVGNLTQAGLGAALLQSAYGQNFRANLVVT